MAERYAVVHWRDAVGADAKKIKPNRITANLPVIVSVGRVFADDNGTLALMHECQLKAGIERRAELTIIPAPWVVKIIELVEKPVTVEVEKAP